MLQYCVGQLSHSLIYSFWCVELTYSNLFPNFRRHFANNVYDDLVPPSLNEGINHSIMEPFVDRGEECVQVRFGKRGGDRIHCCSEYLEQCCLLLRTAMAVRNRSSEKETTCRSNHPNQSGKGRCYLPTAVAANYEE